MICWFMKLASESYSLGEDLLVKVAGESYGLGEDLLVVIISCQCHCFSLVLGFYKTS